MFYMQVSVPETTKNDCDKQMQIPSSDIDTKHGHLIMVALITNLVNIIIRRKLNSENASYSHASEQRG